jgi:hypothetical protein
MMLFKPELIEKIVHGEKTQTRRPVKDGEALRQIENPHGGYKPVGVYQNNRAKMLIGRDYAVQPVRGQAGILWSPEVGVTITPDAYALVQERIGETLTQGFKPLRICITDIWREDVRDISHNDAVAEGFSTGRVGFWRTWCGFYDPAIVPMLTNSIYDSNARAELRKRPGKLYRAWVYTFEVLR